GVIGEQLAYANVIKHFDVLKEKLSVSDFKAASNAILTTDLKTKTYTKKFKIYNRIFTISALAKGSGMIMPNMATMLAFIFTDFAVDKQTLSNFTKNAVQESFNRISVDGDTSTSDTVFVATTNKKKLKLTTDQKQEALDIFYNELKAAMIDLAKKIVMDGEGARKFVTVKVINAKIIDHAKKICFSIANSILVKTAIAGEDANWGRLIMAIGKTKIKLQTKKIKIYVQNILLCEGGQGIDTVDEMSLSRALKKKNIDVLIDLAEGCEEFTVWTSDLTENYIKINADYRS
ncbi:bifunctional ornithine acetyltransferase/N-acetylglutamate synthase, partial [Paracoccaceae bacterium]|nr:bifunctional ornithine acetyltransferase/N-acetylglutamate synthase [Paracoccaceae bacterium]